MSLDIGGGWEGPEGVWICDELICCCLAGDGGSGILAAIPGDIGVPFIAFLCGDQPLPDEAEELIFIVSS